MTFITVIFILSLDRLTKFLVTHHLLLNQTVPIIKGVFHLTLIHNRGAAFGILKNQVPLFIFTSILAIILIYLTLKKNSEEVSSNADIRKSNTDKRRFIIKGICDHLRYICENLRSIMIFQRPLKNTKQKKYSIYPALRERSVIYEISLSLILGGALGNLIDRVFLGYVIDFLDFRIWPVFNVADSAITVGAILLGWSILKFKNQNAKIKITNQN